MTILIGLLQTCVGALALSVSLCTRVIPLASVPHDSKQMIL